MHIIVPAAGRSSRFPNMKPKYLLYDYKHELMLTNAIKPYLGKYPITIGILREHENQYSASDFIRHDLGSADINIVILDEPTSGPAETVYEILKQSHIINDSILIKDCDSFFDHEISYGNYVCVSKICEHEILKKLAAKSFVLCNDQGIITDIIEKRVVSDTFCVGGYKFESAFIFIAAFESLKKTTNEIFVSNVIEECLDRNILFTEKSITNYIDVGTSQDWFEYNDKPVIFCDIDGTLIHNQNRVGNNSYYSDPISLKNNVERMLRFQKDGAQIIFTTSRLPNVKRQTEKLLNDLGFKDYQLIMGLLNSRRILINDYNSANPFPRAEAINIRRNSDNLTDYL